MVLISYRCFIAAIMDHKGAIRFEAMSVVIGSSDGGGAGPFFIFRVRMSF